MKSRLSSAATFSSSWATLLAPMTSEVTRGSRRAQASASWETFWPRPAAIFARARTWPRFSSLNMSRDKLESLRCPRPRRDPVEVALGQQPLSERGEADAPDALLAQDIEEPVLDPAVEHGVRGLMDEQRRPQRAQDRDRLPRAHVRVRRDADVERLALAHRRVECAHRLFEGCVGVEAVVVEDVDVVEPEAAEALVEAGQQVLAGAEVAVRARPHVPARLGRDDQLVAQAPEVRAQDRTEVRLGAPVAAARSCWPGRSR